MYLKLPEGFGPYLISMTWAESRVTILYFLALPWDPRARFSETYYKMTFIFYNNFPGLLNYSALSSNSQFAMYNCWLVEVFLSSLRPRRNFYTSFLWHLIQRRLNDAPCCGGKESRTEGKCKSPWCFLRWSPEFSHLWSVRWKAKGTLPSDSKQCGHSYFYNRASYLMI